jgi:hypothetical protein
MKQWEYQRLNGFWTLIGIDMVNKQGAEGWELVSVTSLPDGEQVYHFKREKVVQQEEIEKEMD